MSGADELRAVLENYPQKYDLTLRAPGRLHRSSQAQQAKLGRRPLPFDGLCVPKVIRESSIYL
jgi:hypothetical protein